MSMDPRFRLSPATLVRLYMRAVQWQLFMAAQPISEQYGHRGRHREDAAYFFRQAFVAASLIPPQETDQAHWIGGGLA